MKREGEKKEKEPFMKELKTRLRKREKKNQVLIESQRIHTRYAILTRKRGIDKGKPYLDYKISIFSVVFLLMPIGVKVFF